MFSKRRNYDLNIGKLYAEVSLTKEARWGCQDYMINQEVMISLIPEASEYILKKEISERFTIVSEELRTVLTGIVTYKTEDDIGLLITNVYGDIHIIRNKEHYKI